MKFHFNIGLTVLVSVLAIFSIVQAGTITPPSGTPSAKFYTLSEIYDFINSNTTATEGGHSFLFSDSLAGTGHTLTEIYSALAGLISADKVKSGTTYLNVAGTLTPDGGTATVAGLFNSPTAHLTADWTLDTGTLNLACNTATFDASGNLVATAYDGAGDGTNRWCMTSSGDAVAGDVLSGKIAWVDGTAVTGTIPTQTLSASSETVSAGYYAATALSTVDTDLITGNIKSGISLFGISGNSNVVDTISGDSAAGDVANNKICFVDGSQITGSMFTNQKNQTIDDWLDSGGTTNEYTAEEATWSEVSGSPFSGYDTINYAGSGGESDLISGTVKQDARTGLWWSDIMAVSAVGGKTSNIFTLTADGARPTDGYAIGFCDALNTASFGGSTGWYLPTQKQLYQAHVDGSANNLLNPNFSFWSSTESYSSTGSAWRVNLSTGLSGSSAKTNSINFYVRCVRP